jgi:hypothetical protein
VIVSITIYGTRPEGEFLGYVREFQSEIITFRSFFCDESRVLV